METYLEAIPLFIPCLHENILENSIGKLKKKLTKVAEKGKSAFKVFLS
jgi:hypothetical protein